MPHQNENYTGEGHWEQRLVESGAKLSQERDAVLFPIILAFAMGQAPGNKSSGFGRFLCPAKTGQEKISPPWALVWCFPGAIGGVRGPLAARLR